MFERDFTLIHQLKQWIQAVRIDFRRREQAEWAVVYLQGLLRTGGRKTVENLARTVSLPPTLRADDVAQALQHFINQSPWDERKIRHSYQRWLADRLASARAVFVLDELAFVKQGRHSVGVQRQYSAGLKCKANCQIAVALHHLSAEGFHPVGLRLYLPRRWVEDRQRLDAAGVPDEARRLASKTALAVELLDEARAAGIDAVEAALGSAWGSTDELTQSVQERGLSWRTELPPERQEILHRGREALQTELGLDHFEGRSWRGFHHHACLVVLAYAFSMCGREKAVETDQGRRGLDTETLASEEARVPSSAPDDQFNVAL